MSVPTSGETFAKMIEYLRLAQEQASIMGHLENANDQRRRAKAWLAVSENLRNMVSLVTKLATGRLQ
jgi:hypothetical protein